METLNTNCFKNFLNVDDIFCISSNRSERLENINYFNEKFNLNIKLIDPVFHVNGAVSLILTNLKIFKENINKNILILEDDFFICDSEQNIINKLIDLKLQNIQYDILFLGCLAHEHKIINENFTELFNFTCTQSIYYKKEIIPLLIKEIESRNINVNTIPWSENDPDVGFLFWDRMLNKIQYANNLKYVSFYPIIITQNNLYSLLEKNKQEFYELDFLSLKPFDANLINIIEYSNFFNEYFVFTKRKNFDKFSLKLTDCNTGFHYTNCDFDCKNIDKVRIDYKKIYNPYWIQVFLDNQLIFRKQNYSLFNQFETFKIYHFYYLHNSLNFCLCLQKVKFCNKNLLLKIKDYCSDEVLFTREVSFSFILEYSFQFYIENFKSLFLLEVYDGEEKIFKKVLDFRIF